MSNVKRDLVQIHRAEHDPISNARRVKLIDTEISIELNHLDGDSVISHHDQLVVSSVGVIPEDLEVIPAMSCSSLKRVQLFIELVSGLKDCTLIIQISPVDNGDIWFDVSSLTGAEKFSDIIDICARRIRVNQSQANSTYELNVHLVGQG